MKTKSMWKMYATNYNVSLAQAIADRDYPATEAEVVEWFVKDLGRLPTADEIRLMHPESADLVYKYSTSWD